MKPFYQDEKRISMLRSAAAVWNGTPFRKRARVCRYGVDCVNLAIAVYAESGLALRIEIPHYHLDEGIHTDRSTVVDWLNHSKNFSEIPIGDWDRQPGDLICFNTGKSEHHVGIAIDSLHFCHATPYIGAQISRIDDPSFRQHLTKVFRPVE